jgi:hypothetical protein
MQFSLVENTSQNIIDTGGCSDYVLTHAKPYEGFTRTFAVLDLLLHERDWPTVEEINESFNKTIPGREAQRRFTKDRG